MRRTPAYDPFDDRDDLQDETPENVRRISTTPGWDRVQRRPDVRPVRGARRPLPRRGPDPRVWFVRGAIGIAALAGLWLGLQTLFPFSESQVTEAPATTAPADASAVGAPEPPVQSPPQAAQPAEQPAQPEAAPAPPAEAAAPANPPAEAAAPAPTAAPIQVEANQGDRLPGLPPPSEQAAQAPAPAQPAQAAAPAQPTAAPQAAAQEETPSQQPVGKPTLEPIPPPPASNAEPETPAGQAAQQAAQQAVAAAAPKPQAPPPPAPPIAQATGGPFELSASASPVNPISERANVTITVRATQGGAPLAGASCMARIYFRTNTVRQPAGGFRTNGNGVGSFTLDARGATYGHYIPVDVTCTGRGGSVTARTGFTPVRGR